VFFPTGNGIKRQDRASRVAQVVECLPSNEAVSSNPSTTPTPAKKKKSWGRKLRLVLCSRAELNQDAPLMFLPCLSSTGNCVCNAGRDHRASHGTLWLPGGPHCGRSWMYVSLNIVLLFPSLGIVHLLPVLNC
jgi:hypothetical protein